MIEITFDESSGGGLKMAQSYNLGEFRSGRCAGIFYNDDSSEIVQEKMEQIQRDFEEKERRKWEAAVPLGGNPWDVYEFPLALDLGDISETSPGQKRQNMLEKLAGVNWEENAHEDAENYLKKSLENLSHVRRRIALGEPMRIWYSDCPRDLCGLYWFMAQIEPFLDQCGEITLLRLPQWEYDAEKNVMIIYRGWGEVHPSRFHRYLSQGIPAPAILCKHLASRWNTLQQENSPLRAVVNSELVSVPETFYDDFILKGIDAEKDEFSESALIAHLLDKEMFIIADSILALRIEVMIEEGILKIIEENLPENPKCCRILRKND